MDEQLWEQARAISLTKRALQTGVMARRLPGLKDDCLTRDFTMHQLNTLLVLRDRGEMSLKEIAEAMGVSSPSASAMVDRLVDVGVAKREHSTVDRREIRISLAAEGAEAANAFEQYILQSLVHLLEKIGPECAQQWCDVYARVQEVIGKEDLERRGANSNSRMGVKPS